MKKFNELKSHVATYGPLVVLLGLSLAPICWRTSDSGSDRVGREADQSMFLDCAAGTCFYKKSFRDFGVIVPEKHSVAVKRGGTVLGLSPNALASVRFPNGSELQISGYASATLVEGQKNLTIDEPAQGSGAIKDQAKAKDPAPVGIFYLGDLEVRIFSPAPNSVIYVRSLPQPILVSMAVLASESLDPTQVAALQKWTIVKIEANSPLKARGHLELQYQKQKTKDNQYRYDFFVKATLATSGTYGLVPSDRPLRGDQVKVKFTINSTAKDIKRVISDELKNLDTLDSRDIYIEN